MEETIAQPITTHKLLGVYNQGSSLSAPQTIPEKPTGATRFVCLSDTHTKHKELKIPEGDVLLHAGDFSYTGAYQEVEAFAKWLEVQPHPHKVVIAGNHECTFELPFYDKSWKTFHAGSGKQNAKQIKAMIENSTKWVYLEDQMCEVNGIKIYGSPWQPWFLDWAFNLERGPNILAKWKMIPDNVDILITHGPPKGHGGKTFDGTEAGCADLLAEIRTRIKPKVHLFGHIHEGYGVTKEDSTTFINGSNCTLKYKATNNPIVFDIL